jgi:hypothetical protein
LAQTLLSRWCVGHNFFLSSIEPRAFYWF